MSRAFVREPDSELPPAVPERAISRHPNLVTATGLKKIEQQVQQLEQLRARNDASTDLTTLARLDRDLRYWRQRRATARVIESEAMPYVVRFGVAVDLRLSDASERSYQIVGEDEADPAAGLISWVSPVGSALIGHRLGDQLELAGQSAEIVGLRAAPATQPS